MHDTKASHPAFLRALFVSGFFICYLLSVSASASASPITINKLKKLYINTVLVERNKSRAVIVAPSGNRYGSDVELLQQRIRQLTGVTLPVYREGAVPEEVLRQYHVIALGNMATNTFIEKLYRQWQVILDLKYPGVGGYVIRSLHNPYGTGRNVIFLGGSDDAGVAEATRVFTEGLQGRDTLKVGWLMKIRLGKGMTPPMIGAYLKEWNVRSWSDSRRKASDGTNTGYDPATFFGWNPISIAGALYYMTGRKEYLQTFKDLAMPDPQHLPLPNRTSDAFNDPADPLVKNYHYRSHLVDCVYDLIEESPLFTDEERLYITNKLLEHQYVFDPDSTYSVSNGDRHAMWQMLCIYTGSRYFARYYPNPVWDQRLANVRKGFRSFIDDPTWGERDTLEWVSTSIEPVFEFFLLDGFDEFVASGTARTMMRGLEVLMSGDEIDDCNRFLPLNLLMKAAYLLKDTRYVWMAHQLGADFTSFRIGQSFWPSDDNEGKSPTDLVGRITVSPLARTDREQARTPVPAVEAFQILSYRTGLSTADDYLLLDGFEGLGRHPYQLNTLLRLRMFGGKNILSGYANDISVWRNGMTDAHVARSAALKQHLATDGFAYIRTEVPDMPGSRWQRHVLYLKDRATVVVDQVIPHEPGNFDVVGSWQMGSPVKSPAKPSNRILAANGVGITSAEIPLEQFSSTIVQGKISRYLNADEQLTLANLFYNSVSPKAITPLQQGDYLISGSQSAFVGTAPYHSPAFSVQAEFSYVDGERLFLAGATELALQGKVVFKSDKPVTILWNFSDAAAIVSASQAARLWFASAEQNMDVAVQTGEHKLSSVVPHPDLAGRVKAMLKGLESRVAQPESARGRGKEYFVDWQPEWEVDLKGKITAIAAVEQPAEGGIWAVSQGVKTADIVRIGDGGKLLLRIQQPGESLSIWPARNERQAHAFGLLAGFKDDTLRAFTDEGRELWSIKAAIHPSFLVGDRYDAPWFTDPRPPNNMTGVYSLLVDDLWGSGQEEIAIGRPCTVEFRALNGSLNGRVATRWGNNTVMAALRGAGFAGQRPLLLAGKAFTGNPQLSGINREHNNVSDYLFAGILPEFTDMHAWLQRGMSGIVVADINWDGSEEVIYTLSGHWNELRVYDRNQKPLWMKFFGPDKGGAPFMSGLAVVDMRGDGFKEVVVGTKNGWITAFDHRGNVIWQRHFDSGITALAGSSSLRKLAVGCADGSLYLLDSSGVVLVTGWMGSPAGPLVFSSDGLFAGSANGLLRKYPVVY